MLLTAIFFMTFALTICLGFINPIIEQAKISANYWSSKNSYYVAESGIEESLYRFKKDDIFDEDQDFTINGLSVLIYPSGTEDLKILRSKYIGSLYKKEMIVNAKKDEDNKVTIIDWREN